MEAAATALGRCGTAWSVDPLRDLVSSAATKALREAARDAINRIHARLVGAEHGQLSLARTAEVEGALSQADEPGQGGELSRVTDEQS